MEALPPSKREVSLRLLANSFQATRMVHAQCYLVKDFKTEASKGISKQKRKILRV